MENAQIPKHVAIIPDGNRRWARKQGFSLLNSYKIGIDKFIEFAKWSSEFGIKTVTIWGLSNENLKNRTKEELNTLFKLYINAAHNKKLIKDLIDNKIRINIVGDLKPLPKELKVALKKLENLTKRYNDLMINLLINYSGKNDIAYAIDNIKKMMKNKKEKIDKKATFRNYLMSRTVDDIDLLIRTSGEMRLSGLLPWQTTYSELYFEKKYWPDFTKEDYKRALDEYANRQRRFGK
ncbi:MAG: polyprenyl diphosphate synthase [Candidatus Micrarchaeia archaeon]